MAYISKENLTSQVNGTNKVFTTANNIAQIDDLFVDGAIYFDYTVTASNEITLTDAPTSSLYIDYYTSSPVFSGDFITVQGARDLLERAMDDTLPNVSDAVFYDWINFINHFLYRQIRKLDPERFITQSTYNITAGTNTYALPSDFSSLDALGTGFYEVDADGNITSSTLIKTSVGSTTAGFFIKGSNAIFTPIPTTSNTYILRYIPKMGQLSALTDTTVIEQEYSEYLKNALVTAYEIWDENVGAEVVSDQRFARNLQELLDNYKNEAYQYDLIDLSQYF